MQRGRRSFLLYSVAGLLFLLVVAWWLVFFAHQGDVLVERIEASGATLSAEELAAVHAATQRSLRMFAFEGGFLFLLAAGGFLLVLRSLRREIDFHRSQRDFLSAITHELRSPIAAARLQVESLLLERVPEAKRERYLKRTLDDLDRLGKTVDQMLTAARASSGRVPLALEPLDLSEFTGKVVRRVLDACEVTVEVEIVAPDVVRVSADSAALGTIVENLVSNAIKYGGEPPRIQVHVQSEGEKAVLIVRDHGKGLEDGDSERVFDAFVRGGEELVRERPGVGLGLYLVAELTRALGGHVFARNAAEGGLAVRVELPLAVGGAA